VILTALGMLSVAVAAAEAPYVTQGLCDGLPRIPVTTTQEICVGLVASGFEYPRGILPLDNGDLLVADMGAWKPNRGSLWLLQKAGSGYERRRLLDKLDRPHGLALGPDGRIYLGVVGRVVRFELSDPKGTLHDVIGGKSRFAALPTTGRHPLVNMAFGAGGSLYVNVGSASDNCEDAEGKPPDPAQPCAGARARRASHPALRPPLAGGSVAAGRLTLPAAAHGAGCISVSVCCCGAGNSPGEHRDFAYRVRCIASFPDIAPSRLAL
jgi:glucose/arabinose dehydrogenase